MHRVILFWMGMACVGVGGALTFLRVRESLGKHGAEGFLDGFELLAFPVDPLILMMLGVWAMAWVQERYREDDRRVLESTRSRSRT